MPSVIHKDGSQQQAAPRPEIALDTNPHYPRYVESPGQEKCYDCARRTQPVRTASGFIETVPVGPDPDCPFCKGTGRTIRRIKVTSPAHHSSVVGYQVTETGERAFQLPPTLQEILRNAPGIPRETADNIVAAEAEKARLGYAPYGNNVPMAAYSTGGMGDPLAQEF